MKSKKKRKIRRASPPASPLATSMLPQMSLYARHIITLAKAAHLLHEHWESFRMLTDEENTAIDSVFLDRVGCRFGDLVTELQTCAGDVATRADLTDEAYQSNLATAMTFSEYRPVQQLAEFDRLAREGWAH